MRRTDRAVLVDSELIGFGLQRSLPASQRVDFQDMAAWRSGVVEVLDRVERSGACDAVVVPMTLVEPTYIEGIHGGLRSLGHDLRHVALVATPGVVRRRLRMRAAGIVSRETWAMRQVDRCLAALSAMDAYRVDNDETGLDGVVEEIATHTGLRLTRPALSRWRAQLRRLRVAAAVIR